MSIKKQIFRKLKIIFITTILSLIILPIIKMSFAVYDVDDCMLQYVNNNSATGGYIYKLDGGEYHVEPYNEKLKDYIIGKYDGCNSKSGNIIIDIYNTTYCYEAKYLPFFHYLFTK